MDQSNQPSSGSVGGGLKEDTQRLAGAATEMLQSKAGSQKDVAVNQARSLSSALGTTAQQLGEDSPKWVKSALENGASTLEDLARTIDEKDPAELVEHVKRVARDSPTSFLVGCAALGFTAARIFKSAGSSSNRPQTTEQTGSGDDQQIGAARDQSTAEDKAMFAFSDGGSEATQVKPGDVGSSL
jgi:hypothetical protein